MIPQNIIDSILTAADIEKIIGNDVQLVKKGNNYTACCPFHNEKTPSFVVFPGKGRYKCFGCGESGNVINWVRHRYNMTFPEAVKKLANKLSIPYEEREQTPEEKEEAAKKESIIIANEAANKFWIAQLKANPAALKYVESRWSKSIIEDMEIGWCPNEWTATRDHLTQQQFKLDILDAAGLVNLSEKTKDYIDAFKGRITIPIRDKSGALVGFTCRTTLADKAIAKYKNTKDTLVFKKSDNLFGLYSGAKKLREANRIILVEGAPDVVKMHQIGKLNTVAPLGTALTAQQIKLIMRYTKNVTTIPDQDPAGIDAAVKNGCALIKAGCTVTIMLLQDGKDADEVLKTEADYNRHEEAHTEDFILWYANKLLGTASVNETEKIQHIETICEVLANCPDESVRDIYIAKLAAKYKPKKVWETKIKLALDALTAKQLKKDTKTKNENFEERGFWAQDNCYYGKNNRRITIKWSNFTMEPLAHVTGMGSKRIYKITNKYGHEKTIELKQEDLVSLQRFRIATESLGNFIWEAGESELHSLKTYLYDNTLSCEEIIQMGWQKQHRFFAWGNGGIHDGRFIKANDIGILTIEDRHYYLPAFSKIFKNNYDMFQFERKFAYAEANKISLYDYCNKYIEVFGNNAKVALIFLFATMFRDIIVKASWSFPLLNIFGPKGTGKTEAAKAITSFFTQSVNAPNLKNSTKAAIAEAAAQVSNALVHFDEYKNDIDRTILESLKGFWDGTGRSRKNMDGDKKTTTTTVDCGVIVTGQEMPTADPALLSRMIYLTCTKTDFTTEERHKFEQLEIICNRGLTHLTREILQYRNQVADNFPRELKKTLDDMADILGKNKGEDRIFKNWGNLVALFRTLKPYINVPMEIEEITKIAINGIIRQNENVKKTSEVAGFWEIMASLVRSNKLVPEVDFKIKYLPKPLTLVGRKEKVQLDGNKKYLLMQFNNVVTAYLKECRETNVNNIPKNTLSFYLENTLEYVGKKNSERFSKLISVGYTAIRQGENGKKAPSNVSQCLVFDYTEIASNYNVSIDEEVWYDDEDDDKVEYQEEIAQLIPKTSQITLNI